MSNVGKTTLNPHCLVSSCSSSLLPVSSLPSTFACWRIPVLWLSKPVSSPPPHPLLLRAATVAPLHPRALRVHYIVPARRALMLLNATTQNAPLLTCQPVISLLLLCLLRILIIPLRGQRGQSSRWISYQFYFLSQLLQKKCKKITADFWRVPLRFFTCRGCLLENLLVGV